MSSVLDLGVPVRSVAEVERELARQRRSTTAHAREGQVLPVRASVLTLVVYATRRAHAERAARTVALLAEDHPSRALILFQDPHQRATTLTCHLTEAAGHRVCYEQIVVRTPEPLPQLLRSIAIPLVVADLPVFLWWTGTPPIDEPHFGELLALAHRLVIDSADFARPDRALPRIRDVARSADGRFGVTDLNWTRLTPWRELLAQFFDVPEWRVLLDAVSGIRVSFAVDMDGREIHPSQALLLIGWLAARLGWRPAEQLAPSEAGGLLFRMARTDARPIWVRARPRFVRGIDEGHLTGVRLLCEYLGRRAEFIIRHSEDDRPLAITNVLDDGRAALERTLFLPTPSVVELLGEELTITRSDTVYEAALSVLCALTEGPR